MKRFLTAAAASLCLFTLVGSALAAKPAKPAKTTKKPIWEDAQNCTGTPYEKAYVILHTVTYANQHPETKTIGKDPYTLDLLKKALTAFNTTCHHEKQKAGAAEKVAPIQ